MTTPADSQKSMDAYLATLRKSLRELSDEDASDIVEELRTHILEKVGEHPSSKAISSTLLALGSPAELAAQYGTPELLARGRASRSPAYIARSIGQWALTTLGGVLVFTLSATGFSLGGWFFFLGFMKLLHPATTGVYGTWTAHDRSFNWQSGGPNQPGELLGWWLVPIGIILGGTLLLLTFRFGTWSVRKLWRPRRWQTL